MGGGFSIIIPTLQMGKLRHREVRLVAKPRHYLCPHKVRSAHVERAFANEVVSCVANWPFAGMGNQFAAVHWVHANWPNSDTLTCTEQHLVPQGVLLKLVELFAE